MTVVQEIEQKLNGTFHPTHLQVIDESDQHVGHAGHRPGGQSHFRVIIRAPAFAGQSRLERHRAVHAALGHDLVARIHALALRIDA